MGFVDHDDTVMNKFNESVQIEETDLYKEGAMKNRPGMEDGPKRKVRNYTSNHADYEKLDAVTNDDDGTSFFKLDTLPEKGVRTIDVYQGGKRLFSISVGSEGVCYQTLDGGRETGCFTMWEDET